MAEINYIGNNAPDGNSLGLSASEKVSFHGVTPVVQAAHIANPTDLATALTAVNAILVVLEEKGLTASA